MGGDRWCGCHCVDVRYARYTGLHQQGAQYRIPPRRPWNYSGGTNRGLRLGRWTARGSYAFRAYQDSAAALRLINQDTLVPGFRTPLRTR